MCAIISHCPLSQIPPNPWSLVRGLGEGGQGAGFMGYFFGLTLGCLLLIVGVTLTLSLIHI